MASRPRRSAATRASESISVHAKWADSDDKSERSTMASRRSGRTSGAGESSMSAQPSPSHGRQSARAGGRRGGDFEGGEIVTGKRNRGAKKSYVVDSSPDDEDEEEEDEAQLDDDEDDEDMEEDGDEDAEGEEDMDMDAEGEDVDAEGEEDAEGDLDMDIPPPAPPTIKLSRASNAKPSTRGVVSRVVPDDDDDDDDDELSDPGDSDGGEQTLGLGDETMGDDGDEDAEGEEVDDLVGDDAEEGDGQADSDDDGSQDEEVNLDKMTKRQRARFDDGPQEFMKLSDEVQAKKVFTAEELSMRRQEMARRRRNLSEKRNEEVKMETINKLLKKQAPKVSKKAAAAAAGADGADDDKVKATAVFVRWVNNKDGSRVGVTQDILEAPAGEVFQSGNARGKVVPRRMVEEVA